MHLSPLGPILLKAQSKPFVIGTTSAVLYRFGGFGFTTLRVCVFLPSRMARTMGPLKRIGRSSISTMPFVMI